VLVGGDPYTKEEKICVKTIEGKDQCSEGTPYGPDGFLSTGLRTSRDDNASARKRFGKGGPDGWRTDGLSKVKLEPEFGKVPHEKGVISLRRFANRDSAGSQFIISMGDMVHVSLSLARARARARALYTHKHIYTYIIHIRMYIYLYDVVDVSLSLSLSHTHTHKHAHTHTHTQTAEMDGQYAAFGKVVSGIDLLEKFTIRTNSEC